MPAPSVIAFPRRSIAPVVFLYIDGKPADDLVRRLISFEYKKTTQKASETRMLFQNHVIGALRGNTSPTNSVTALGDDRRFFANTVWQFRFGYFGNMSPIHTGILRSIEPSYSERREVSITLFDHSSKLGKSSSSKNWGKIPSSEIARQLATKYGLQAVVEDSEDVPTKSFIQPGTINDLMFLKDLAADINYEVFVHDSPPTLVYRSTQYDAIPGTNRFVFSPGTGGWVKSFKPKIKSLGEIKTQASKAQGKKKDGGKGKGGETHSNDKGTNKYGETIGSKNAPAPKQRYYEYGEGEQQVAFVDANTGEGVYIPKGAADTLFNAVPGATVAVDGVVVGKKNVGEQKMFDKLARDHAKTQAVPSGGNTRAIAKAKRQQLLDKAEEASSEHPLIPDINVGLPYEWDGLDKPFNRKWYCTAATHRITGSEVSTALTWKRDDPKKQNKNTKKPKKKEEPDPLDQIAQVLVNELHSTPQETIKPKPPISTTKPAKPVYKGDQRGRTSASDPFFHGPKF